MQQYISPLYNNFIIIIDSVFIVYTKASHFVSDSSWDFSLSYLIINLLSCCWHKVSNDSGIHYANLNVLCVFFSEFNRNFAGYEQLYLQDWRAVASCTEHIKMTVCIMCCIIYVLFSFILIVIILC